MKRASDDPAPRLMTPADRSERARRTCELLRAAAPPTTEAIRRALLLEVAALNADVVAVIAEAMASRAAITDAERCGLLAYARAAYVDLVLELEPPIANDFVARIAPPIRDAVRHYLRSSAVAQAGLGG